jgi:hypothetical protein
MWCRIIFVGMLLIFGCCGCSGLPPDNDLLQGFKSHRADLEKLLEMSNEDKHVVRIAPTFTRLEDDWRWPRPGLKLGFSEERWESYKQLFQKIGIPYGIQREGDIVFFDVAGVGLGNGHGAGKGYAYIPKVVPPLVTLDSLDDGSVRKAIAAHPDLYRKTLIERVVGNWYLFRD